MASLLRQIVAVPRARHPEAGLDLCYVTDNIIATSGPSGTYPQLAYRNPLSQLVSFLDSKHGSEWAIWEFRAEGTGYPDSEVYGRVRHYPWPDHHPPPFALIPLIMGSMRNWLKGEEAEGKGRVVVVHCKAGKGRSGTVSCSYLISEEGWSPNDAMQRFTERRMRPGFGAGISIPSQLRWIGYVDRWTKAGKVYVERPVEVLEVHIWGLRDGVKIAVEGFVDEGKTIKCFHVFNKIEREIVRGQINTDSGLADLANDVLGRKGTGSEKDESDSSDTTSTSTTRATPRDSQQATAAAGDVVFRPSSRVVLPSSDIEIDFERRNKSKYGGFTMVTSVAHVWFNTYFEGRGPEQNGIADDSGVFEIEWDAMDGLKGSSRKGARQFNKMAVLWKAVVPPGKEGGVVITQPPEGQEVKQTAAADWRGVDNSNVENGGKDLGLRAETPESAPISRANSIKTHRSQQDISEGDEMAGLRPHGPDGEDEIPFVSNKTDTGAAPLQTVQSPEPMDNQPSLVTSLKHLSTADLPDGKPEEELHTSSGHSIGHVKMAKNVESSS